MLKKVLVVAHPDDEVIFFNSGLDYDKIYFVFNDHPENPDLGKRRKAILNNHLLKGRIKSFDLIESNFWKDKSKEKEYRDSYDYLIRKLKLIVENDIEFWTHNAWGEYGHDDHILVHQAVIEIAERFDIPVYCYNGPKPIDTSKENTIWIKNNLEFFDGMKKLYLGGKAWTYEHDYEAKEKNQFFKVR